MPVFDVMLEGFKALQGPLAVLQTEQDPLLGPHRVQPTLHALSVHIAMLNKSAITAASMQDSAN